MSLEAADKRPGGISGNDLKSGEKNFEIFFKENFISLCSYCQYRFGFDLDLSKEIVHTAFIKLWEVKNTLKDDVPVKTYLQRIITNKALDTLKHNKVKEHYIKLANASGDEATNDVEDIDLKEMLQHVHIVIADMPEQMRKIFELSRFEGLKYKQIAEELNISPKTVETQMSRALAKLRQRLAEYLTSFIAMFLLAHEIIKFFFNDL